MPLLALEPCGFPDNLLTEPDALSDRPGNWMAVYTKSKGEKALARHLRGRGVFHYLPLARNTWKNKGRTFTSYLPLFPGYVFLHGDGDARVAALESNLISRVLEVSNQSRLLIDLRRVDRVLTSDAPVERADALIPGRAVEIIAGPFQGLQGTLIRYANQLRLVVAVTFLQQAISVEVEGWMVEPVGRPAFAATPA
jgi:transcription antitermination factor NusG